MVVLSGLNVGNVLLELCVASATKDATWSICVPERRFPNEGIPLPPLRTWRATVESSGLSSSRFGPIWPFAFAASRVWQLAQPALAKTLAPGECDAPPEPPQPAAARPIARRKRGRSFMVECVD